MNKNFIEIVTGAIVLAAAFFGLVVAYKSGDLFQESRGYVIKAEFEEAEGILVGSEVKISGVRVGKVVSKSLNSSNYYAVLKMQIDEDVKLPSDTSAAINGLGFMKDKYVSLLPGSDHEYLNEGDSVDFTQSAVNLESLLGKLVFGAIGDKNQEQKEQSDAKDENVNSEDLRRSQSQEVQLENIQDAQVAG